MSAKKRFLKFLLPVLIIALAAVMVVYMIKTKPEKKAPVRKEKAWPVQVVKIEPKIHKPQLVLYGVFEPEHESILTSTINANVNEVEVFEGDNVAKNTILLELDRSDINLLYQQKEADLEGVVAQLGIERQELSRFRRLKKKKLKSASEVGRQQAIVTKLKAQEDVLKVQLAQIKKDQARATVKAPFNALVTKVFISPGNRVRPGDRLLSLYDVDNIQIRAQLPNKVISTVRQALHQREKIVAYGEIDGTEISATLSRISAKVAATAIGTDAIFVLNTKGFEFGVGRSIKLVANLPGLRDTFVIPYQSLYGLNTVYVVRQGRIKPVTITKISNVYQDKSTLILATSSELQAGDEIIATQLPNAITGLKVSITK